MNRRVRHRGKRPPAAREDAPTERGRRERRHRKKPRRDGTRSNERRTSLLTCREPEIVGDRPAGASVPDRPRTVSSRNSSRRVRRRESVGAARLDDRICAGTRVAMRRRGRPEDARTFTCLQGARRAARCCQPHSGRPARRRRPPEPRSATATPSSRPRRGSSSSSPPLGGGGGSGGGGRVMRYGRGRGGPREGAGPAGGSARGGAGRRTPVLPGGSSRSASRVARGPGTRRRRSWAGLLGDLRCAVKSGGRGPALRARHRDPRPAGSVAVPS